MGKYIRWEMREENASVQRVSSWGWKARVNPVRVGWLWSHISIYITEGVEDLWSWGSEKAIKASSEGVQNEEVSGAQF